MKNIIFINGYNNYYNRRVKYSQNLNDYIDHYECFIKQGINFNPNDGVKASLTANLDIDIDSESPDYALLLDENNNILSRWFVMDLVRSRNGQYVVSLKRDVIADHFDDLRDLPVFVQKGNLEATNTLIYNKEGINVNQIKKEEILLKQYENDTAWIVGYVGNDIFKTTAEGESIDGKVVVPNPTLSTMSLSELPIQLKDALDPSAGATLSTLTSCELGFNYVLQNGWEILYRHLFTNFNYDTGFSGGVITDATWDTRLRAILVRNSDATEIKKAFTDSIQFYRSSLRSGIDTYFEGTDQIIASSEEELLVNQMNGQTFYSSTTGKFYRLSFTGVSSTKSTTANFTWTKLQETEPYLVPLAAGLEGVIDNMIVEMPDATVEKNYPTTATDRDAFYLKYKLLVQNINLVEIAAEESIQTTITAEHNRLNDAPYSMFAMPFNLINLALATKMAEQFNAFIYDIQILPYCPAPELLNLEGTQVLESAIENQDYNAIISGENNQISFLLWPKTSSGTFNIYKSINVNISDPVELKLANECDMYRIVSPNYNGAFEFSAAKNLGVEYFRVWYTYKPYAPYIQVAPKFANLYGGDFNDARGLICNGDFSIATLTDQWRTYEINNKNYENIFNAQIKTMDKNHELEQVSNGISSAITAIGTGLTAGYMTGSWQAGAIMGGLSAAAGAADMAIDHSIFQNNRQLQKDLYGYNLQNIQARPDTLNKISAYNINNKYFPFIEYYTCSDVERNALRNKIKYEGMTVMAIGTIDEYIGAAEDFNYFKGQLIQAGAIQEDYHIIDAICVELERGIYLPGGIN